MTDEDIIEIRDSLLPSQGESFDCLAFARAVERRAVGSSQMGAPRALWHLVSSGHTVRAIDRGSDEHLTLLGAPWHMNMLTGQDRADMLSFGRACMEGERRAAIYAKTFAIAIHAKHYAEVTQWRPLPDLLGILTQIDNMTSGLVPPNVEVSGRQRPAHKDKDDTY